MTRRRPLESLEDPPEDAEGRDMARAAASSSRRRTHQLLRLAPKGIRGWVVLVAVFATVSFLLKIAMVSHMGEIGGTVAIYDREALEEGAMMAAGEEGFDAVATKVEEEKSHGLGTPRIQEVSPSSSRCPFFPPIFLGRRVVFFFHPVRLECMNKFAREWR